MTKYYGDYLSAVNPANLLNCPNHSAEQICVH